MSTATLFVLLARSKGPDLRVVRVCPGCYKERKKHSQKVQNTRAHTYADACVHESVMREEAESNERDEKASRKKGRALSRGCVEEVVG